MTIKSKLDNIVRVNELFESQVKKTPNNIAFVYNDKSLSYKQLNDLANQLAHYISKTYELTDDSFLILCLERGEQMIISILASLKIGLAYVPIDPEYPNERIAYILKDTQSSLVITNYLFYNKISSVLQSLYSSVDYNKIILIDKYEVNQDIKKSSSTNFLSDRVKLQDLAYIIYTSGTTGVPKGVMIEHRAIINLIRHQIKLFYLDNSKKKIPRYKNCLWFANYVFDAHVWDVFAPLCTGHTLHMINNYTRQNLNTLAEYIEENNIYLATIPPALLDTNTLLKLQFLVVAGEKTEQKVFDYYVANKVNIINAYGPTETTVCSHTHKFTNGNGNIIGKPLENMLGYVLDENLQKVPDGAIGELYISGIGVARGYLNMPELTQDKFINNPYLSGNNGIYKRLYKTGDFVRLLPNGDLEYIERRDQQVKINGYRIDLGEIETQVSAYPQIQQSIVLALDLGEQVNKCLVAFYVSSSAILDKDLVNHLMYKLPVYMIPNKFVFLEKFPLTINGKIDKAKLPVPELFAGNGLKPRNDTEKYICKIFTEALSLKRSEIDLSSDFVSLGGNSIIAGKITAQLNKYFGSNLQISEVLSIRKVGEIYDRILLTKNLYKYLVKLNLAVNKPVLFMIHDGIAGCELYTGLASTLEPHFICYGIDNYNLYHDDKVSNLEKLAEMYIEQIKEIMKSNNSEHYYFFGVCLGGIIATYMALILENMGYKNITVISWDSVITDDRLQLLRNDYKLETMQQTIHELYKGASPTLVDKIVSSIEANNSLMNTVFLKKLNFTNIVLFKALEIEDGINYLQPEYAYICSLPYNNFENIQQDLKKIEKIELPQIKHSGLLANNNLVANILPQFIKS